MYGCRYVGTPRKFKNGPFHTTAASVYQKNNRLVLWKEQLLSLWAVPTARIYGLHI